MTREEFIEKNNLRVEIKALVAKTGRLQAGNNLSLCFKTGDFIKKGDRILNFKDIETGNAECFEDATIAGKITYHVNNGDSFQKGQLLATIENEKIIKIYDTKGEEYIKTLEEHRQAGDLMDYCYSVRDESPNVFDELYLFLTKEEYDEYNEGLKKHIKQLFEAKKNNGTLNEWLDHLKKNDLVRFKHGLVTAVPREIGEIYRAEISEHRSKGDLIDYVWNLQEELKLWENPFSLDYPSKKKKKIWPDTYPFEYSILRPLFTDSERKELWLLFSILHYIGDDYNFEQYDDKFKYIFKLYQSQKDSIKYKRYEKIKSRITRISTVESLDKCIHQANAKQNVKKVLFIGIPVLIIALIVCVIIAL